LRPAFIRPKGK
uniref:Hyposin-H2 n=1 Tax=Pithecopus azureus TaxID=2034991 RepID=HPS2_PITAZ|nr:RecName: Full=Hyposin-H2; Short=HPS-H2; AltName: Full=Hyposin-2; AltName: Full=Hyposin-HA2 [Pithecopus azureus]